MPYLTCESCGLSSFAVRSRLAPAECPGCGDALSGSGEVRSSGLRRSTGIKGTLTLAREMLSMDVAMVSEITEREEIARHVSGEWSAPGALEGRSLPLQETLCARMLEGKLSNYVCDARSDQRVNDLQMVRALGVGAWIGVPMQAAHARLYVLCCLAREARPQLQQRDVYALTALSHTMLDQLERRIR